jgi:hypothetical protein
MAFATMFARLFSKPAKLATGAQAPASLGLLVKPEPSH